MWLERSEIYFSLRGGHLPQLYRKQGGSQNKIVYHSMPLLLTEEKSMFLVLSFCIMEDVESQILSMSLGKRDQKGSLVSFQR